MISAVVYRLSDGHIVGLYSVLFADDIFLQVEEGCAALPVDVGTDVSGMYVLDGELAAQTDLGETRLVALVGDGVEVPDLPGMPDSFDTSAPGLQIFEFTGAHVGRLLLDVVTIDTARARLWSQVKALRDARESGGAGTPLGTVDSDPLSVGRITGAVVMAQVALSAEAPFSIDWTMADNSVVAHDAAAMIAMGVAVGAHVDAVHARARALRGDIEAATTLSALELIDIEAGWPT